MNKNLKKLGKRWCNKKNKSRWWWATKPVPALWKSKINKIQMDSKTLAELQILVLMGILIRVVWTAHLAEISKTFCLPLQKPKNSKFQTTQTSQGLKFRINLKRYKLQNFSKKWRRGLRSMKVVRGLRKEWRKKWLLLTKTNSNHSLKPNLKTSFQYILIILGTLPNKEKLQGLQLLVKKVIHQLGEMGSKRLRLIKLMLIWIR